MKIILQAWNANSLADWGIAAAVLLGGLLGLAALRYVAGCALNALLRAKIEHRETIAGKTFAATSLWLLSPIALYAAASTVELPAKLDRLIDVIVVVALMLQVAWWLNCLVSAWLAQLIERRREADSEAVTILTMLGFIARAMVWTFTLLLILNHLDVNITALVTGLGIGGVAIALAVQNILGDLFASLSIILDKPFVFGDFIVVDSCMGTVEHIGLKTTRVRSLGGELIVFSNADLLKSRIRNYKRMYQRRVVFTIGVAYETSADDLHAIPHTLREIVEASKNVRFDRAHFKEFGECALTFEVVYYVCSPDFNVYMDIQQAINLAIFQRFQRAHIEFAFPTRVLHVKGGTPVSATDPLKLAEDRSWSEQATG